MAYSISLGTQSAAFMVKVASRFSRTLAAIALFVPLATCGDATAPDPIATQLAINAALSNVVAGAPITLSIELTDDNGEKVASAAGSVSVAIAAGTGVSGAVLSGTLTATASAGAVTFSGLSINKAGTGYKLVVSATGLESATSSAFDVAPGAPSQIAIAAGNSQTATAGSAVSVAPSVEVKDALDNLVGGASVTFAVASGGGSITGATQTANASGVATVGGWTLGTTMGANSLTATVGGVAPATISATGTAGAPSQVAINSGNAQTAVAGVAVTTAPSVIVKDANNNVVSGASVTFAVAAGGGSITGATQTTNASGIATVGGWTLGTTMGANSLSATVASLSAVTINATGTAGVATQIAINAGNTQSAVAGAAVATKPSVIVKDANNNAVSGVSVSFAVASGAGTITGAAQATDANGVATVGNWTLGTTKGANSITAAAASLSVVTFNATGVSGTATQIAISGGNAQSATAGSAVATKPSVIVKDANSNVVGGVSVTFAIASGGGSITGATQTTDSAGVATVGSWTLGTTVGANAITATATGLTGSPITITATGVAGAPTQIAINAGNAQSATAGSAVATKPSVIVKDAYNNVVSDVSVAFAVASGGGSITGGTQTTDANGVATVGSWTLGTAAGSNSLTATATGLTGSPVTISATGVAGAATQIAITAGNNQSATAGSAVSVSPSVVVKDANNNVVSGVMVTFAVTSGGGTIVNGTHTQATNANGLATVISWTLGAVVGTNTLTATSPDLAGSPITFTATGNTGTATQIAIHEGDAQTAVAGSLVPTLPKVIVKDANGNPVAGVSVTFAVASGGGTVEPADAFTGSNGVVITAWTLGTTAGSNTLTATATGLTGAPITFSATSVAGAPTQIAINAGDGQTATVNTSVATAPSVIVRDAYNNLVSGAGVEFTPSAGSGGTTGVNLTTDANGVATVGSWTLGVFAGTHTLSATVSGVAPVTFTATGVPDEPNGIQTIAGSATAIAGGSPVVMPKARVIDRWGNGISGITITFAVVNGGGTITGDTKTTDAQGHATVDTWVLSTYTGFNKIDASVPGLNLYPAGLSVITVAGSPVALDGFGTSGTAGTEPSDLPVAWAADVYGNLVPGATLIFKVTYGGTTITGDTVIAGEGGAAQPASMTMGTVAQHDTLTVSSPGLPSKKIVLIVNPGAAAQVVKHLGDNQSATNGYGVDVAPQVKVMDAYGNAVNGAAVTFAVASGGGSVSQENAHTNSSGIASSQYWQLGTTPGTNTVTATAASLTGSPLTFTATGVLGEPYHFNVNNGDQTAAVGSSLSAKPGVTITDINGNPHSGIAVTFTLAYGDGSITGGSQTTNASGVATIGSWTLGTVPGQNALEVGIGAYGTTYIYANAVPGAPANFYIVASPKLGTPNTPVANPPSVYVMDEYSNVVTSGTVTFAVASGGGSVTGGSAALDENSQATLGSWTLGPTVGAQTLTATIGGLSRTFTVDMIGSGPITVGAIHSCTLSVSSKSICWGGGWNGQLGDSLDGDSGPTLAYGGHSFVSVTAGGPTTCALKSNGAAYCWGGNPNGQVGNDNAGPEVVAPSVVLGGLSFASLAIGRTHTCGLTSAGAAYCWGAGAQVGDGVNADVGHPVAVAGGLTFTKLSAYGQRTCGLSGGDVYCWGSGGLTVPTAAASGLAFAGLTIAENHACGWTAAGVAWCWGLNYAGQLGNNDTGVDQATPVLVSGGLVFASLTASESFTCGRTTAGAAYCWGNNYDGQLGDGTNTARAVPTLVSGSHSWLSIGAGDAFACGLTTDKSVYCWGGNSTRQLAQGDQDNRLVPTLVPLP